MGEALKGVREMVLIERPSQGSSPGSPSVFQNYRALLVVRVPDPALGIILVHLVYI